MVLKKGLAAAIVSFTYIYFFLLFLGLSATEDLLISSSSIN
jgi:hypothetical protein